MRFARRTALLAVRHRWTNKSADPGGVCQWHEDEPGRRYAVLGTCRTPCRKIGAMRVIFGLVGFIVAGGLSVLAEGDRPVATGVAVGRLPDGGIQPQAAVDGMAGVHMIFFRGTPAHGDLFYMASADGGRSFAAPIQVNSIPGSAIATGTVRGGQIAIGRSGRVHVAWNGSQSAGPGATPMFYTRLNAERTAFEPQRSVMHAGYNIDGGGAVAADRDGHVYVVWHANVPGEREEGQRRVWVARSDDDGRTFEHERAVFDEPTGACGCCGLGAFADRRGALYVLFRSAFEVMNRDMYLLTSRDLGRHFDGKRIDRWTVGACVMSTEAFAEGVSGVFTAWETKGQIYLARIDDRGRVSQLVAAPGDDRTRKHPALAVGGDGTVLLAWTEGTAWSKGGAAAWQLFSANGRPIGGTNRADGVPVWGLVAAYARPGGTGFVLTY